MSVRSSASMELVTLAGGLLVATGVAASVRDTNAVMPAAAVVALAVAAAVSFLGARQNRPFRHVGDVLAGPAAAVLVVGSGVGLGVSGWICLSVWVIAAAAAVLRGRLTAYGATERPLRSTAWHYALVVGWPATAIVFFAASSAFGWGAWTVAGGWELISGIAPYWIGTRRWMTGVRRVGQALVGVGAAVVVLGVIGLWVNPWTAAGWLAISVAAMTAQTVRTARPLSLPPGPQLVESTALQPAGGPPPGPWPPVDAPPVTGPPVSPPRAKRETEAWQVGDRIADLYEVRDVHGQGAMGLVYRVRHLAWDVDLAVKSPRPELFATEVDRERFVREAQTWVSLGLHPNVCACHYVRSFDGVPRVFAEYVGGGSLRDRIDDRRLYQGEPDVVLARVLDLAIQIAWGLAHAHGHAVVHQDVKPANILLTDGGTAKVTDFGLARAAGTGGATAPALRDGSILVTVGGLTPAYASPEQAARAPVGRRSDIWSFAVTVLEMFTGELTWMAGPAAGAALAAYREPESAADLAVPMPSSVADVLASCLTDDPAGRPATLDDVAARLVDAYESETGSRYGRPRPAAAQLRADELTNHALSLLDLGREDDAQRVFAEALRTDPRHLEAVFNVGLLRWRTGLIRDDELIAELEAVGAGNTDNWRGVHLLGQIHLERGDPDAARPLLERAAELAPDESQVRADVERARDDRHAISRVLCTLPGHDGRPVRPTHVSGDRRVVLSSALRSRGINGGRASDVVGVWDGETGQRLRDLDHRGYPQSVGLTSVCSSPDGRLALTGSGVGVVHVWDTATGERRDLTAARAGHGTPGRGGLVDVCLADNGRFALSRDESNQLKLWDLPGDRCVEVREATCLVGNGRVAVAAEPGGAVLVWDLNTGRLVYLLTDAARSSTTGGVVGLSQDGRFALSTDRSYRSYRGGPDDQNVRVWDLATGRCVAVIAVGPTPITALALDRDARIALTGNDRGAVDVWEVSTGRQLRTLQGHSGKVTSIRFSADGALVVTNDYTPLVTNRSDVRVWEVATGRCRYTFEDAICTPSGRSDALTGDRRGQLREWTAPREPYVCPLQLCRPAEHTELARRSVQLESLIQDAERAMTEQRLVTAKTLLDQARRIPSVERSSAVLASWRRLAERSRHVGIRAMWPERTMTGIRPAGRALCLSADGTKVLVDDGAQTLSLWDVSADRAVATLDGRVFVLQAVSMSPDARIALSSGSLQVDNTYGGRSAFPDDDYALRVWDLTTGRCRHVLRGHTSVVGSTAVSADGRLGLSAEQYRATLSGEQYRHPTIRVWDLHSGHCLRVIETQSAQILAVAFSPDGRFAVSAEEEAEGSPWERPGFLRVWDLATGRCLHVLRGHERYVSCLQFSADARTIVSGGAFDGTLRVWDTATGVCLRSISVGEDSRGTAGAPPDRDVRSLALTPDGRYALIAGPTAAFQVWDLTNGQCLHTVDLPGTHVRGVGWSGDGRYALAGTSAGLRRWEVDWELAVREPADWDEGARPFLSVFVTRQTPLVDGELRRHGRPSWTEDDFQRLLRDLRYAGYGWLSPDGVRAELERMTGVSSSEATSGTGSSHTV
ncbi:protein kinase domain-containing protein [Cryptosporangium aurantiacum]|uniref:Serine/threonine protein kinase n=1 Tax=Cryptosporangium aurantiacum TaxID=134849 RepID=A0A1M7RKY5_9ACTN|nr:protein kinase [Cryptosporangium aurantiacum]SHN47005.1 Serine/threonine protein kinase [Cryptosporangium aurantiacum]